MQLEVGRGSSKSSTPAIYMDPNEMVHIIKEMQGIAKEFQHTIAPALKKIEAIQYVEEGKAKKAMKHVPQANKRVLELQDHYERAATLIVTVVNAMIAADREVGEQITKSLNIGG